MHKHALLNGGIYYDMKKILVINTIGFSYEGITNVAMNYIENMNRCDMEFVFCVFNNKKNNIMDRLKKYGSVVEIPPRKSVFDYMVSLYKLMKKNNFDVVHIHGNSGTMVIETTLCKINKINKIIIHCHSTKTDHPIINSLFKRMAIRHADICLACSSEAGDFLYGKKKYFILNNAVKLENFEYNEEIRRQYRRQLGIDGEIILGHVGHATKVKNQEFLVDIYKEYYRLNPNSKLLVVSDGPLLDDIKEKVKLLDLQDNVIFVRNRSDVECLYQAMDVFIFPSLWEGLGLVAIEAQISGLPVLASSNVPAAAGCTDRFYSMDLELGEKKWAEKIEYILSENKKRSLLSEKEKMSIRDKGYDIKIEAGKLEHIYREYF